MTKPLVAVLVTAWLVVGAGACGGSSENASSGSSDSATGSAGGTATEAASIPPAATVPLKAPQRPGIKDTYDEDDKARRRVEENDDEEIEIYGRPATSSEWRSAAAFAKSYFEAADAENGAAACKLLVPSLAAGIGGQYEASGDPVYLHGKTCAEVMTKLFEHRHKLMAAEAAGLEITDVRITSQTAFVLLAFKGIRERRYMGIQRDGSTWKLEALMDSQYP